MNKLSQTQIELLKKINVLMDELYQTPGGRDHDHIDFLLEKHIKDREEEFNFYTFNLYVQDFCKSARRLNESWNNLHYGIADFGMNGLDHKKYLTEEEANKVSKLAFDEWLRQMPNLDKKYKQLKEHFDLLGNNEVD